MKTLVARLIILATILGGATVSRAETEIGNGGDGILCHDPSGTGANYYTAEVYDAFEARVLMELPPDFGAETDPVAMARFAARRLARLDPVRSQRLIALIDSFMSEARIIPRANLRDIPDTDPSVIPLGCSLKQLVIQYRDPAPRMPRYLVDKDVWDLLDPANKAYLILHEVIYFETIRRGATDSKSARYFNAYIASNIFHTWSQEDYDAFLREELKLPALTEVDGLTLDKATLVYDDSGVLLMGKLSGTEYFTPETDSRIWRQGGRTILLDSGSSTYFTPARTLWKGRGVIVSSRSGSEVSRVPVQFEGDEWSYRFPSVGSQFVIEANGNVLVAGQWRQGLAVGNPGACFVQIDTNGLDGLRLDMNGMPVGPIMSGRTARAKVGTEAGCRTGDFRPVYFVVSDGSYEFYPDGHLRKATLEAPATLLTQTGSEVSLAQGSRIELDASGRLLNTP